MVLCLLVKSVKAEHEEDDVWLVGASQVLHLITMIDVVVDHLRHVYIDHNRYGSLSTGVGGQ